VVRLIALFEDIPDVAAFRSLYEAQHLPLAQRMPGLCALRHQAAESLRGRPVRYVGELLFPDRDTLNVALRSVEGFAAAKTLSSLPCREITLFIVEGGFES